jgi:hypothetical protein
MKKWLAMVLVTVIAVFLTACTPEETSPPPEENDSDVVALYRTVFNDLYEMDTALNSDIAFIALDLTRAENLSQEQQETLAQLLAEDTGLEVRFSTYKDLVDQRLIVYSEGDSSFTLFETGILFTFVTEHLEKDSFRFSADKWRSSLGAYGFSDCTATLTDDGWTYQVGSEFIS